MCLRVVCSSAKLFVFVLCIQIVSSQLPADQISAMASIYEIIQNDTASSFVWNNVLKTSNPCLWEGVGCSSDNSSITTISLQYYSISNSEFLPFVCKIATLESLDVSGNQLSSIPAGLFTGCGEITGLKSLTFGWNKLLGPLPTFYGFAMLETLDFSKNMLSGEISMQLDGLDSLTDLDLSWNRFRGNIPTNLGKMNLLERLVLSANLFRGEIPVEITKYKNLSVIDLGQNHLSGSISVEITKLKKLRWIDLSQNHLSGSIPMEFGEFTELAGLNLSFNSLSGTIPTALLSGVNLQDLDLSFNNLEGPISAITSTNLYSLRLGSNSLTGMIPFASLASGLSLMYLELDNNRLSGQIPRELGMFNNLFLLNLANNRLSGTLRTAALGNLTNLLYLNLELNNFIGAIPPKISRLNILERLNLARNSLSGEIPISIGNLFSLVELQLGNNQLNGPIPTMPELPRTALNLSHNLFQGLIPTSLSRLHNLQVLDLSNNRFSGEIPSLLTDLSSLTQLLLMNNELSGVVPTFRSRVRVDTTGNKYLVYVGENPSPATPQRKRRSLVDPEVRIAAASGFLVGLLIAFIAILISRKYNRINGNMSTPNSIHTPNVDFKKAMETVANPSNIIFNTTFSTFYKVVMPSGTTYLAKKINHSQKIFQFPRHKQLVEELEAFGSLSNSNVMVPIAYVLTVRRAYLFYDFVRGTMHDVLHHRTGNKLDWPSRYNIVVGVAKGLAFLHECSFGPIILLDLCSKTILLKSLGEPQISDIELCKLIDSSNSGCSVGYVPPKYGCTKRATAAGNVYSFGVVLLELLTGKPAVSEGIELAKWVLGISKLDQILDSNVCEMDTSVVVRNQMLDVVEVALACISVSHEMRPNAVSVVQMLLNTRTRQTDVEIS